MGLLDGSDPAPDKTLEVEDSEKKTIPNPAYGTWITRDQQFVSYLIKAISPDLLGDVLGLEHAVEIWAAIDAKFPAQT